MSTILCDHRNCTSSAREKCSSCGNVFCIRHIQLVQSTYLCDICRDLYDRRREKREEKERELYYQELKRIQRELEMDRPRPFACPRCDSIYTQPARDTVVTCKFCGKSLSGRELADAVERAKRGLRGGGNR
jgi:ribosomal protein L37AE/L43A